MNAPCRTASMPGPPPSRLMGWLAGVLTAIGAAFVSCAGGASAGSGVQGAVTLSPACGGPQREGVSCNSPYADVELRLMTDGGAMVASTRTSATGRYLLAAPAGRYRLQVMTPVKITRCPSPEVVVVAKQTSVVDIECDSGMR
jgi:hypothetical protein